MITHDRLKAMTLADVLVVINVCHVEQLGALLDFYEKLASTFFVSFISTPLMSLLLLSSGQLEGTVFDRSVGFAKLFRLAAFYFFYETKNS